VFFCAEKKPDDLILAVKITAEQVKSVVAVGHNGNKITMRASPKGAAALVFWYTERSSPKFMRLSIYTRQNIGISRSNSRRLIEITV
jgi:hypothetical protein